MEDTKEFLILIPRKVILRSIISLTLCLIFALTAISIIPQAEHTSSKVKLSSICNGGEYITSYRLDFYRSYTNHELEHIKHIDLEIPIADGKADRIHMSVSKNDGFVVNQEKEIIIVGHDALKIEKLLSIGIIDSAEIYALTHFTSTGLDIGRIWSNYKNREVD